MLHRGAFYRHLADAIAINRTRASFYAQRTGGRSRLLSHALIAFERMSLPTALWLDGWAQPFQARGVPIIEADFIDMVHIAPAETPPRYSRIARAAERACVWNLLRALMRTSMRALKTDDFHAVCAAARTTLLRLETLEEQTQTYHAMARHFVESVGISALHAPGYAEQTGGETLALSRWCVWIQVMALPTTPFHDRLAQENHKRGIGILVNDVPHIPFLAEYAELGSGLKL